MTDTGPWEERKPLGRNKMRQLKHQACRGDSVQNLGDWRTGHNQQVHQDLNFCYTCYGHSYHTRSNTVTLQGLPLQLPTNAVPGTGREGHVSIWMPSLAVFREESLRLEFLRVWEDLRISMQGISYDNNICAFWYLISS